MAFFNSTSSDIEIQGKAIVIPVVSTANIGQLAVDLLITSFDLEQIGIFDPQYFIPAVGSREDGKEGITTPLSFYGKSDLNFVVIQQRSPTLKGRKEEFVEKFLTFIASSNFSAVLFLSGVDLSDRTDAQMLTPIYQLNIPNPPGPIIEGTPLHSLRSLPIPTYSSPVQQNPILQLDKPTPAKKGDIPFIPGGGLTRRILTAISTKDEWKTPTASLLQFVLEGDNRADAALLASVVSKILGLEQQGQSWKEPESWSHGLFGSPHDQSLYG